MVEQRESDARPQAGTLGSDSDNRPIAVAFSAADLRSSLQHQMFVTSRPVFDDAQLAPRERRRFDYRCGACGHLQEARVWDIAAHDTCAACGAVLIVPAPDAPPSDPDARAKSDPDSVSVKFTGLFCPYCGRHLPHADRSRVSPADCPRCLAHF